MGKKAGLMRESIESIIRDADVEEYKAKKALSACVDYTNKETSEIVLYYSDNRVAAEFELPLGYMLEAVRMWARDCEIKRLAHEEIMKAIPDEKAYQ
jgi:hypothetical protein